MALKTAPSLFIMTEEQKIIEPVKDAAMAFHKWMIKEGWHEHSSREYYYSSKDFHQWPPDKTATEKELLNMFFNEE